MRDLEGRISANERVPSSLAGLQLKALDWSGIARKVRTVIIVAVPEKQEV